MKVRDDKVCVVYLQVERPACLHDAGHSAQNEDEEKSQREQERRFEYGPSCPDRRNPAEDLDRGRNDDHHRGGREPNQGRKLAMKEMRP